MDGAGTRAERTFSSVPLEWLGGAVGRRLPDLRENYAFGRDDSLWPFYGPPAGLRSRISNFKILGEPPSNESGADGTGDGRNVDHLGQFVRGTLTTGGTSPGAPIGLEAGWGSPPARGAPMVYERLHASGGFPMMALRQCLRRGRSTPLRGSDLGPVLAASKLRALTATAY